jgi:tetratricopeptide (TPR) repeat protein
LPGAERELKDELASNPGSLVAKLGMARLQVEQGSAVDAAKELAEIEKADASFLQASSALFAAGLAPSRRSELQHALQEGRASGEIPDRVVLLFKDGATAESSTDLAQSSSDAASAATTSNPPSAATLYAAGNYGEYTAQLEPRLQQLSAADLQLLVSSAYSTAKYRIAFEAGQKLALNAATEAEGLYWETRSAQKLAIEALARASAIDSNSPTLHVLLGDVYRQRRYYPDAEQEYRKAMALQPEDTGAMLGLSLTLLADSENDEALRIARAAMKKNPEDPELNAVVGEILSAQHDFSAAEPYLRKALNTKSELIPHVHALLGRVYAETNRTQQAITELQMGLADDKDGRLHYQLGRLYLKVGDRDSAKKAFDVSERLRSEGLTRAAVAMRQGENNSDSQ